MPVWHPTEQWKDRDVFIIGGGASLKTFDWELLQGEFTIGCNAAYTLGPEICNICVFGDSKFYEAYKKDLEKFGGVVATSEQQLHKKSSHIDWLWTMRREPKGLHKDALGWNKNTGALAINLALILGAKRVILLGFDMHLSSTGSMNWHDKGLDKPLDVICSRINKEFQSVYIDWKAKFLDREIINVTNNSSLSGFPKIGVQEFWTERKKLNG